VSAPTVRDAEHAVPATVSDGSGNVDARVARVAAVVLTYNEERNLPDCLASLSGWVSEIFVVDSGSTDGTLAIAREAGATVLQHPFEHYGAQRNWAIDNIPTTAPWTLHIDADERVTPELSESITAALAGDEQSLVRTDGFLVSRRTMFMGRWIRHGGHYPAWHLRLIRTGAGRCEGSSLRPAFLRVRRGPKAARRSHRHTDARPGDVHRATPAVGGARSGRA
jgi:glycosyltransferase involved in cell wall biosynthesis